MFSKFVILNKKFITNNKKRYFLAIDESKRNNFMFESKLERLKAELSSVARTVYSVACYTFLIKTQTNNQ